MSKKEGRVREGERERQRESQRQTKGQRGCHRQAKIYSTVFVPEIGITMLSNVFGQLVVNFIQKERKLKSD